MLRESFKPSVRPLLFLDYMVSLLFKQAEMQIWTVTFLRWRFPMLEDLSKQH